MSNLIYTGILEPRPINRKRYFSVQLNSSLYTYSRVDNETLKLYLIIYALCTATRIQVTIYENGVLYGHPHFGMFLVKN